MSVPENLKYTKSHEWVRIEDDGIATVGITDHAQEELGDVVFVELPEAGEDLGAGEALGTIESVKAVSDLYAPVGGEVVEVNESLNDTPERVNEDPYGEGWLVRIRIAGETGESEGSEGSGEGELLTSEEYEEVLEQEN